MNLFKPFLEVLQLMQIHIAAGIISFEVKYSQASPHFMLFIRHTNGSQPFCLETFEVKQCLYMTSLSEL